MKNKQKIEKKVKMKKKKQKSNLQILEKGIINKGEI